MVQLEFELTYFVAAVPHFTHYAMRILHTRYSKFLSAGMINNNETSSYVHIFIS